MVFSCSSHPNHTRGARKQHGAHLHDGPPSTMLATGRSTHGVRAQLGQQPLVRTTETSLEPRRGTLSCLSARPPDLAFWTGGHGPGWWACPRVLSHFYSKALAHGPPGRRRRDPSSPRYGRLNVVWPLRLYHSRTYPINGMEVVFDSLAFLAVLIV